ncbi:MAG: SBBP repeat-containing protein [Bacteroidetes bacterium]|nr:SBBP repeat-containing protein [Bacteroidota bacterium]
MEIIAQFNKINMPHPVRVKTYFFNTIFFIVSNLLAFAANNNKTGTPDSKEQIRHWMQNQSVKFLENKGQMTDMEGNPVPFVLFKAEVPGLDMYITERGITYTFLQAEEKEDEQTERENKVKMFTESDENIIFKWERVDMELKDASIKKENVCKENPSTSDYNYFYGHCPEGIYGVKQFDKIVIRKIYPGIDWVLYNSSDKGFKYDFIVHPGADPNQIQLVYSSLNQLKLNNHGEIKLKTDRGTLTENAPYSYIQETDQEVASKFQLTSTKQCDDYYQTTITFSFITSSLNHLSTLIIDPQLTWGTLIGGNSADGIMSMDCDASGNIYVAGYTTSTNFPTQSSGSAYFQGVSGSPTDAFIVNFSNSGILNWATYYGGSNSDYAISIEIDISGNIYVAGYSASFDFPAQAWGSAYFDNVLGSSGSDVFILRFSNTGARDWATLYGGNNFDNGYSIDSDVLGNIYITGSTRSIDFPVQSWGGAYFNSALGGAQDGFVLRFSATGNCDWATYYGGSGADNGYSIKTNASGNIYITGITSSTDFPIQAGTGPFLGAYLDAVFGGGGFGDAFILRFSNAGIREWATFYGGSNSDEGHSITIDVSGNMFLMGVTKSSDFPTQNAGTYFDGALGGTQDVFILKFDNAGIRQWATYYGGSNDEIRAFYETFDNIQTDNCGNLYVSFDTRSTDITTLNPGCGTYFDGIFGAGTGSPPPFDIFITKFTSNGQLLWASYIGSNGEDLRYSLTIDNDRNLFLAGEFLNYTSGTALPLFNPGGSAYFDNTPNGLDDSFILKFTPVLPTYTSTQVNISSCACDGTATVTVTNCGALPLNYIWSNGNNTINSSSAANTITNLCPGPYWVEVTDATCNRDTIYYSLTGSAGSLNLISNQNANCSGLGSATITATNGTAAYTYFWNNGQTAQTATGLTTGNYTVTVTDSKGCTASSTAAIISLPALTGQFTKGTASCTTCGCKEWIMVTAAGGTSPYTYLWPDGSARRYKNQLCPGAYTINIKDKTGCNINIDLAVP